jgi:orotidine-5'-phosphate decarboxylase
LKIGKELFTRGGPELVRAFQDRGFDVFLDLKFHDIPNTVAAAVRATADLGVWMVNVHAQGGSRMMAAAVAGLEGFSNPPLLIAVTVLTSMDASDLAELGVSRTPQDQVMMLAGLAHDAGLDGVVCSALEAESLRTRYGEEFSRVTPGIRLAGDDAGDPRRVVTPRDAMAAGSSYLVIGRSITASVDPEAALEAILADIA